MVECRLNSPLDRLLLVSGPPRGQSRTGPEPAPRSVPRQSLTRNRPRRAFARRRTRRYVPRGGGAATRRPAAGTECAGRPYSVLSDGTMIAVTRAVSPRLAECELTHLAREPIDIPRACAQHAAYEQLLCTLGDEIVRLPPAPDLPDGVFVEDTALVLGEIAVITRPGARTRRLETSSVAALLAGYRGLRYLTPPATLDGGDVLGVGRTLYVGRSTRTNQEGVEQLGDLLAPFDYRVVPVDFTGCLHLK